MPPAKKDKSKDDLRREMAESNQRAAEKVEAEFALEDEQKSQRRKLPKEAFTKSRTTPIAVRFDEFTLKRLRALADSRNTGYQTLLKEFVVERLYEEEKREGIIE